MSWITSRVFWKLVGAYIVLSAVALFVLILLHEQLTSERVRDDVQIETQRVLTRVRDAYESETAPNFSQSYLHPGQSLLLVRPEGSIQRVFQAAGHVSSDRLLQIQRDLIETLNGGVPQTRWSDAILVGAVRIEGPQNLYLVLNWDISNRLQSVAADGVRTLIAAWICSSLCVALIAARLTAPLRLLAFNLSPRNGRGVVHHLRSRLSLRSDEFGTISSGLDELLLSHNRRVEEVRQREEDLRNTARQVTTTLEAMTEGVIALDLQEQIQFANSVACSMMEMEQSSVTGRLIYEAVRNTHFQTVVREAVHERRRSTVEFHLPRSEVRVFVSASPVPGSGAVIVLNDVTEVRRLEAMRSNFVSSVSHELKTPLTVIQACTETLLNGALSDERAAPQFLTQIDEQAERLLELILRMLHLARIESGEQAFSKSPVDLVAGSRSICESLQPMAASRNVELTVTGDNELFVLADSQSVHTVISSLVDNAIRYTPAGGHVSMHVYTDSAAGMVSVIDNGQGIPPREHKRVFERFYRLERDRNRERGGTGLGLAIAKHLCQAMEAEIQLQSDVGAGCTFTVRFPFQD